jgi:spore photoproduct lyase
MDLNKYNFTVSQKDIIKKIIIDLKMWNEKSLDLKILKNLDEKYNSKQLSKKVFETLVKYHEKLKRSPNNYKQFKEVKYEARKFSFQKIQKNEIGLGACPVASEGTRCCNLLTLDAVEGCGFDCSYCSIQSFYNQNIIGFDKDFKIKLNNLNLNPNKMYHIGTGQSSDSLMWGNHDGILGALFDFAYKNPNIILEFKTKSNNIKYFLKSKVPKNIIVTWSLNTQVIIDNEEHLTASLKQRLNSARQLANKNILVGFHFHPIIVYDNYLEDYKEVYDKIQNMFSTDEVVLISLGTLTFIKPVMKKLRERELKTKILQMPFKSINGKQSYDLKTKQEMFKHAYNSFKPWHGKVYFYLCMETHTLWKDVFGYEYSSNNQFEDFMLNNYMNKIMNL